MRGRRGSAGLVGALLLHAGLFALLDHLGHERQTKGSDLEAIDLDLEKAPVDDTPSSPAAPAPAGHDGFPPPTPGGARTIARAADRAPPSESADRSTPLPPEAGSAFVFNPVAPGLTN